MALELVGVVAVGGGAELVVVVDEGGAVLADAFLCAVVAFVVDVTGVGEVACGDLDDFGGEAVGAVVGVGDVPAGLGAGGVGFDDA